MNFLIRFPCSRGFLSISGGLRPSLTFAYIKVMRLQLSFKGFNSSKAYFGGSLLVGKRKGVRPISSKHALHLILKASRAKGSQSFLKHHKQIQYQLDKQAKKFGIRIYQYSNVGNHLHFLIRIHSRREYKKFIRAISSLIQGIVTKTLGANQKSKEIFWDFRPFSRVVSWGRDFRMAAEYVIKNTLEVLGLVPYIPRKSRYSSA